jgi:hypothetical protein
MRASVYLLSILAQDEETQKKGCVGIFINMKAFGVPVDPAHAFQLTNLMGNLGPIRYVGYHFCSDDPQQTRVSNLETIVSSAQESTRVRFRFHSGKYIHACNNDNNNNYSYLYYTMSRASTRVGPWSWTCCFERL